MILYQMIQKSNRYKVLKVFFDNPLPSDGYQLREISRITGLGLPSVTKYLNELVASDLIIKKPQRVQGYPRYWANRESTDFKLLKKQDMALSLHESGLINYIEEACSPAAVVLFGSASRGEDLADSDVDVYVQCSEKQLKLEEYEKKIKRKINIFFEKEFKKLSKELKNSIVNGRVLKGYLEAF